MHIKISEGFETIDNYMTQLFHSGLTKEQMELVQAISKEICKLYNEVKTNEC